MQGSALVWIADFVRGVRTWTTTLLGLVVISFGAGYLLKLAGMGPGDAYGHGAGLLTDWAGVAMDWLVANFRWAGEYTLLGAALVVPVYALLRFIGFWSRA